MVSLTVTDRDGSIRHFNVRGGQSLMEALRDNHVSTIIALCGGNLSCATCHVYLNADALSLFAPRSQDEDDLLDASDHRQAGSRLSCQLPLADGMPPIGVTVAPED